MRVLSVIVIYERDLDEVKSWSFLRQELKLAGDASCDGDRRFLLDRVLIYDNSSIARAQPSEHLPGCIYVHDPSNGGTAAAYDRGLRMARGVGIDWMLLLDQDTSMPTGFLEAAGAALANSSRQPGALVPWVFHNASVVSPARVTEAGTIAPLKYGTPLPIVRGLTAISSGSLFHVPTLASLMPMPNGLWLDYVDHWIFSQLRTRSVLVAVFDASLQHELSVRNIESMNLRRLTSILNGEAYFQGMLGTRARLVYPFRLAARIIRYTRTRPDLAMHMLAWIFNRIRQRV